MFSQASLWTASSWVSICGHKILDSLANRARLLLNANERITFPFQFMHGRLFCNFLDFLNENRKWYASEPRMPATRKLRGRETNKYRDRDKGDTQQSKKEMEKQSNGREKMKMRCWNCLKCFYSESSGAHFTSQWNHFFHRLFCIF